MSIHQLFKGGAVSGPVDEAIGGAQSVAELVTRHLPRVNKGFALLPWTVHAHSTEALIEQQLRLKVADYRAGVLSPSLSTFVLNLVNASHRLCDRLSVREVHQSMAVPYLFFARSFVRGQTPCYCCRRALSTPVVNLSTVPPIACVFRIR